MSSYGDPSYVAEKVKDAYAAVTDKASFGIPPWYQQGYTTQAELNTGARQDVINDFLLAARIRYGVVQPNISV